jgi:signal transduction histidine kinase
VSARTQGPEDLSLVAAAGTREPEARDLHDALEGLRRAVGIDAVLDLPETEQAISTNGHAPGALLAAPIRSAGEVIGVLYALREGSPFADGAHAAIEAFAECAGLALGATRPDGMARLSSDRVAGSLSPEELVLKARDFEELVRWLLEHVCAVTGVTSSGVSLFDEQRNVLRLLPGSFRASEHAVSSAQFLVTDETKIGSRVFSSGEPYMANSMSEEPRVVLEYMELFKLERLMSLPLQVQGEMIGVLHLGNKPKPFTRKDLADAHDILRWVGTVLEVGRMVFNFRRQQRLERILGDYAAGIASGHGVRPLIARALAALSEQLHTDVTVLKPYSGGDAIVWRRPGVAVDAATEEAVLHEAERCDELSTRVSEPSGAGDPGQALLVQPIKLGVARVATVCAYRGHAESFVSFERNVAARFASMTAVALRSERYRLQRAELTRLRERQRIANDLHDHAAQLLFIARLKLETVLEQDDTRGEGARAAIEEAHGLINRGDDAIRQVIHALMPAPTADLGSRFAALVEELEDEFDVPIHLDLAEEIREPMKSLRNGPGDVLLRVARETIVNAVKHGDACVVSVRLAPTRDGKALALTVRDDGIGISAEKKKASYGLNSLRHSLREHGGSLRVSRGELGGASVAAKMPI